MSPGIQCQCPPSARRLLIFLLLCLLLVPLDSILEPSHIIVYNSLSPPPSIRFFLCFLLSFSVLRQYFVLFIPGDLVAHLTHSQKNSINTPSSKFFSYSPLGSASNLKRHSASFYLCSPIKLSVSSDPLGDTRSSKATLTPTLKFKKNRYRL